ncbi:hypothetical protein TSUD_57970 [Trifolium subterraneum]|uniref:Uncharacterized protein n=1 Tax=Trifolium subterraneum TaxID=3900 RepID=A0A2Z6N2Z6_TRISU|nr:hypothetical protein TSUD_57970 [Trifolium subterraneum]
MVEVEQLLEPEERQILQQNVTPNLKKISSEKWGLLHSLALSLQIYSMDKLVENGCDIDFLDKAGTSSGPAWSLSGNGLSGPIPTEIGDIASLEDLVLENNQQRMQ